MAQKLQNINTGAVIEVSDKDFKSGGQALSDLAGFVPVGKDTALVDNLGGNNKTINNSASELNKSSGDIFARAGDLLKDYETPMSLEEIRQIEQDKKIRLAEQAASIFDPMIKEARETGEKRLGSGKGQVGISRGLGLSTAETSYLRSIEKETEDRISDINKQKAEFISSGNFQAAEQAENMLMKLQESKNNLLLKKIELGLQLGQEQRAERAFEFDMSSSDRQYQLQLKEFNSGEERFKRIQSIDEERFKQEVSEYDRKRALEKIQQMASGIIDIKSMSEEDITSLEYEAGMIPGTFEAFYNSLVEDVAMGKEISALEIEQKKAQISRTYALSANTGPEKAEIDESPMGLLQGSASMLSKLRDAGQLNDILYDNEVSSLMTIFGADPNNEALRGGYESMINRAMEGIPLGADVTDAASLVENEFGDETVEPATAAGKAVYNFIKRGGVLPEFMSGILAVGSAASNFISGLVGGRAITKQERLEISRMIGGR